MRRQRQIQGGNYTIRSRGRFGALGVSFINFINAGLPPFFTFTRASSGTDYNSLGAVENNDANVPRFDYNPATLASRGLLMEASRTNIRATNSEDILAWNSNVSPTRTANTTVSPDGTVNADTLTTSASAVSGVFASFAVADNTTYTFSWYMKYISGTGPWHCGFGSAEFGTGVERARIFADPLTGAITSPDSGVVRSASYDVGNGWWRFEVTATTALAVGATLPHFYAGDTSIKSVAVWGWQLEAASFASSYIPVTTVSVTRAADVASVTNLASIGFNPTEGTLLVEFENVLNSTNFGEPCTFNDGSNANKIGFYIHSNGGIYTYIRSGGVSLNEAIISSVQGHGTVVKLALAYKNNDFALYAKNGLGQSGSRLFSVAVPTGMTRLTLGSGNIAGWIRRVTYYPTRLPNAQLQALTA